MSAFERWSSRSIQRTVGAARDPLFRCGSNGGLVVRVGAADDVVVREAGKWESGKVGKRGVETRQSALLSAELSTVCTKPPPL